MPHIHFTPIMWAVLFGYWGLCFVGALLKTLLSALWPGKPLRRRQQHVGGLHPEWQYRPGAYLSGPASVARPPGSRLVNER